MSHQTISCATARALSLAATHGELTPAERADWRAHVAECAPCRRLAERLDDVVDAAATAPDAVWGGDADADDLFAAIEARLDAEPDSSTVPWPFVDDSGQSTGGDDGDDEPSESTRELHVSAVANHPTLTLLAHDADADWHSDAEVAASSADTPPGGAEQIDNAPRRSWAIAAWFAVAAAVLALVVRTALVSPPGSHDAHEEATSGVAASETPAEGEAVHEGTTGVAAIAPVAPPAADSVRSAAVPELTAADVGDANVRLFASATAEWRLARDGDARTLTLDAGGALVELIGDGVATLHVDVEGWSVDVVGTAFYVAAGPEPDVRVLVGAVDVHDGGATRRVVGGEQLVGTELVAIAAPDQAVMSGHVDVATHLEALRRAADSRSSQPSAVSPSAPAYGAARRDATAPTRAAEIAVAVARAPAGRAAAASPAPVSAPVESETTQPPSTDPPSARPPEGPLADLRDPFERADAARRLGDWSGAAAALEEGLAAVPRGASADAARLDLARIYIRQLGAPERAIPHLQTFVARNPHDVAAQAARDELCRISATLATPLEECNVQQSETNTP
ncbi:MAG: zf-HC2 domain-containing protein [Myxococcales bacterium]|nr:zf-HC2 domain-containing protein [Myxococcales bacterium]